MANAISEPIELFSKPRSMTAYLQVTIHKALLPVPIVWENDETLMQIFHGPRVFVAQYLVYQVAGAPYSVPIHGGMVQ